TALSISPEKLIFETTHAIGTTSYSQVVTVKNDGKIDLRVNAAIVSGENDFAITKPCPTNTLASGAECVISIEFAPIGPQTRTGRLRVNYQPADNSAPAANKEIDLQGTGAIPKL